MSTGLSYAIIPLRNTRTLASAWFNFDLLPEFERRYAELYPFALTGDEEPFAEARRATLAGIIEDPATGSAAGPLAAYLAREGLRAWGARAGPGPARAPPQPPHPVGDQRGHEDRRRAGRRQRRADHDRSSFSLRAPALW